MGMIGQRGPDGSLTYNQTGSKQINIGGKMYDIPQYEAVTQLSDVAQKRFDTTNAVQQNMADVGKQLSTQIMDITGKPISYEGMPELAGSGGYSADRTRVEDAINARLRPQQDRARASLEQQLADQGIRAGSEAYDRAQRNQGMTENDARTQTILAGGQEQLRLAGLDSSARAQTLQERTGAANEPINRLSALLSQTQVNTPQYQTYTPQGMATTDVAGITQQGFANQEAQYQQKMAQQQATIGAIAGLGGAALSGGMFGAGGMFGQAAGGGGSALAKAAAPFIGMSDRRLKKDITKVGKADGHNVYKYRYLNEDGDTPRHTGVMAQEVERTRPDAVVNTPAGKAVNYTQLFGLGAGI